MRYRMNEVKIGLDQDTSALKSVIENKIGKTASNLEIVKESIDARREEIKKVYTVDFDAEDGIPGIPEAVEYKYVDVQQGEEPMKHRPVVVGFGPCGMFCALELARRGYKPIIIERGYDVDTRAKMVQDFWEHGKLDEECNVQFGEGGAGTFSDGKLTTGIRDERITRILKEFVKAGAPEKITYVNRPHLGTDVLRVIVKNIRKEIESLGGRFIFFARMNDLRVKDGKVIGLIIQNDYQLIEIETDTVVLAIGNSARDTVKSLLTSGVYIQQKPLSIGVRIEHPQEIVDQAQYGDSAGDPNLPPAIYNLAYKCANDRGVYTFCMCPGGEVIIASSEQGMVVTNGMSYSGRDSGTANSGLLVEVRTTDYEGGMPTAGIDFQQKYERIAFKNGGGTYKPPKCTWKDFREGTEAGMKVRECLPDFAVESIKEAMPWLGRKVKGFDSDDAILTAVETRSSSPVRIQRDDFFESNIKGLFPGGEGSGYAGGIMSSAVDGIKIAEELIKRYAPMED